ncbi:alpha/beta hydrolase family protein [Nocardia spumae]|uniref:alpha/beta hydrolase family protein n=1 Tax=Nocardia spumae TaxID=2887190 RepID=UPI001D14949D|nr:dienelactone hydrolase family protein [Nocardia spumae]
MTARQFAVSVAAVTLLCTGTGWVHADDLLCSSGSGCPAVGWLPSPVTGPAGAHPVGRVDTTLTAADGSRTIMASVWYPASRPGIPATYVPAGDPIAASSIAIASAFWLHTPAAAIAMVGATVAAAQAAPVDRTLGRLPVVVVSPGLGTPRWILSGLAEEIASRGYAVVAMDHTGEVPAVEFPSGRIVFGGAVRPDDYRYMRARLAVRLDDSRLTLDRLTTLPVVGPLIDLDRIAMLGHSYGGLTAVQTAAADPRVRAAVVLDGSAGWNRVADAPALDRPVLLLAAGDTPPHPSWTRFHDPHFARAAIGSAAHYSATDLCAFGAGPRLCGTMNAARAAVVSRGVVVGWLERHLLGHDRPRPDYPEVVWQQGE